KGALPQPLGPSVVLVKLDEGLAQSKHENLLVEAGIPDGVVEGARVTRRQRLPGGELPVGTPGPEGQGVVVMDRGRRKERPAGCEGGNKAGTDVPAVPDPADRNGDPQ